METSPLAKRLATRFVAGETLDQALAVGRRLNSEGITVTLDHLGESVSTLDEAAAARDVYLRTLSAIHDSGIQGNVSLKLTQFGLDFSYDQCRANVEQLVRRAAELDSFVRVDMESSEYTDRTLDLVNDLHRQLRRGRSRDPGVSLSQQERRRESLRRGIRVRLCKGAYLEPHSVAFAAQGRCGPQLRRPDEDPAGPRRLSGHRHARRAHDRRHQGLCGLAEDPADPFEFQMLYGIRRDLQRQLVAEGYRLRLYVPFGKAWYPYYMRRLAERPANVFFILRNLFRSKIADGRARYPRLVLP